MDLLFQGTRRYQVAMANDSILFADSIGRLNAKHDWSITVASHLLNCMSLKGFPQL